MSPANSRLRIFVDGDKMTSEEQTTEQRFESIMSKIKNKSQEPTIADNHLILSMFQYRYHLSDTVIGSFSSSTLLDNIDYLLRAVVSLIPYNPKDLEDPNMRSYIFGNINAASYGLTSETRKNIFIKNRLNFCDKIGFNRNFGFTKFKFFSDGERPHLLLVHDYGDSSITNHIEEIVGQIESLYLNDLGVNIYKDEINIHYKDVNDFYMSVKLDENLENPKWNDMDAKKIEWFENIWGKLENVEKSTGKKDDDSQKEDIWFIKNNQPYSGYKMIRDVILKANKELTIVDPYLDGDLFDLLEILKPEVKIKILTSKPQKDSKVMASKFKEQRSNFELIKTNKFHDRYIIVDEKCYLLGSSINSFGKKATTLVQINDKTVIKGIRDLIDIEQSNLLTTKS